MQASLTPVSRYNVSPGLALTASAIVAFIALAASTVIVVQQPWLGVTLVASENGLLVEDVAETGPSAGILYAGDMIVEIADTQGDQIQLEASDIMEDPDTFATFGERNRFRDRQSDIYRILRQPIVLLSLEDDRTVRIQPQERRPLSSLPFSFWLLSLYAAVALLVGTAVWSVRQQSVPTRFLLLSGFGAIILLNSVKIITLRELALDGSLYPCLTFIYHLGNNMFALGIMGLVWRFPKHLGRFPVDYMLIVYMAFFMFNENFEWTDLPGNSVLIQVPFYIAVSMGIMVMQWMRSRDNPVDRATIKALILMIWILIFSISGTYITNVLLFGDPRITLTNSFFGMFFVYIMLSLAVIRYRLFDIDRWWLEIWLWFFAGVAIVAFDIVLVALIDLMPSYAIGISVIIVAWLYFPVRQRVWGKFYRTRRGLEDYVPILVRHLVETEQSSAATLWRRVLDEVFRPLSIETRQHAASEINLVDNGVRMYVPCLQTGCCMDLYYAEKGRRLFNKEDVKLAQALLNISKSSMAQREFYVKGTLDERKRIMRDLHDDVGGRLLTLAHSEEGKSTIAVEALKSLREIIYALDVEQNVTLNAMVARWRIEALERCELEDVGFAWQWQELESDIELSPRHCLNLTMALREALSNVFAHSVASGVEFHLSFEEERLYMRICNDGARLSESDIKKGKGLSNMSTRIGELGGNFAFDCTDRKFCVKLSVPLSRESSDA